MSNCWVVRNFHAVNWHTNPRSAWYVSVPLTMQTLSNYRVSQNAQSVASSQLICRNWTNGFTTNLLQSSGSRRRFRRNLLAPFQGNKATISETRPVLDPDTLRMGNYKYRRVYYDLRKTMEWYTTCARNRILVQEVLVRRSLGNPIIKRNIKLILPVVL
jgi:hypothetical protein